MKTPHYLRFVQALVLAASAPACAADEPTAPADPTAEHTEAATPAPDPSSEPEDEVAVATPRDAAADAAEPEDVDAGLPFFSGPIVPPELPARLV